MNRIKLALIAGGALIAAPAFADDQAEPAAGGTTEAGAGAQAGGAGAGMEATASAGGVLIWSPQLLSNPVTLPKGKLGAFAAFEILKLSIPPIPPATMGTTTTAEFLALGAGYGITDKITAGLTYAVDIHDEGGTFPSDDRWKGPLDLYGEFNLKHDTKMSVTVGADFGVNLGNTDDKGIGLGASFKYYVSPKLAVYTGNPLDLGPAGQHITISLADKGPIDFHLPVGVALQATPEVFAYLDTEIMNIGISNSANAFIFSDFIPVNLGVLYHVSAPLDVGINFADDLKAAGDFFVIGLTGRYHM